MVINEIHYDPAVKTEAVEFIELYNAGTVSVDLSGWTLSGGADYTIPGSTSLGAGDYLVVAQDAVALLSKFGATAIGPWNGRLNNDGENITLRDAAGSKIDEVEYQLGFPWPTVGDTPGRSIELIHPSLNNNLAGSWRSSTTGPTPAAANSTFAATAPPQIRQVDHSPKEPMSGEVVVITAKITDPEGVAGVNLHYQLVDPGAYIELTDTAYSSNWTTLSMNDSGTGGDAMAGDSVYSATLQASVQQHRRLVRYRISATDGDGAFITVPYADDPQPNFAYFCYDGVPAWQGAIQPGTTSVLNFGTNIMRRIPSVHLVSGNSSVETATWFERYTGDEYKWTGTLVYDGKVYDHIHYRARGGAWRYAMVKNMWKFDFNRGHDFQMRDNYGKKFDTKWTKLNLGACIQQGDTGCRGEQGMFESVGSRLFNLAGVESFNTAFLQLRIIDDAQDATTDQYEGDFWGLYLAIEQQDGRFLDEHHLPDGNLYKMEGGSGELNNLGPLGPTDKSDLNYILNNYTGASDAWWQTNWKLDDFYSYQTIVQAIHHYDINNWKNFFYYRNPDTGLWKVIPWDLDLTWADNMYKSSWGGLNALASRILDASASDNNLTLPGTTRAPFRMEFRNRIRELRDLLFNADQAGQLIDEQANLLRDPSGGTSFLDADRAMWDYNPKMNSWTYSSSLGKAGTGKFYQWPYEPGVTKDFNGCVQLMKDYVEERGTILDSLAADSAIPYTPYIVYTGEAGYPLNGLVFQCSGFVDPQGSGTFAAMQWRVGEVLDASAPAYDPTEEPPYEITAKWESGVLTSFNNIIAIPVDALKVGHAYRMRIRMKDTSGRWSHWSAPVQFITGESSTAADMLKHLRISELMYDPVGGSDYEFIELHNTSTSLSLDLGGAAFTKGIDYTFPDGTTLEPNDYLLVIGTTNTADFRVQYGISTNIVIAGAFSGSLSNNGDELELKTAPGGSEIAEFEYNNGRHWPLAAAGAGHSLVPLTAAGHATGALDYPGNWRAGTFIGGSPGEADSELPESLVLNEITAHTDYSNPANPEYDSDDWIELYNASPYLINLDGFYLSDDPANPGKWACPAVNIPAGERLVLNEVDDFHNPISAGFGLDKAGEQVLLSFLSDTPWNFVLDAIGFKGQENGRSLSRIGNYWYATDLSQGSSNTDPIEGLRISEIMFQPAPLGSNDNVRDEYIEIYNPTASNITMQTDGEAWRIDGGVEYTFPDNTSVPAGTGLLVVGFDPTDTFTSNAFVTAYGITNTIRMFGPWSGKLGNRSEPVSLERPQAPDFIGDSYSWVIEDETVYANQSPWPVAAGNGVALERLLFHHSGLDPDNWIASVPTPGDAGASPHTDQDGDGMSDYDEFICGTDPFDVGSNLQINFLYSPLTIGWTAVSGRTYSIYWTDDLHNPFVPVATNLIYPQDFFEDAAHSTNAHGFYQLDVSY